MNSRVPPAEVGLEAPAQQREAVGQLPVLERPGEVERAGLSLQERQVVDAGRRWCALCPSGGGGGRRPRSRSRSRSPRSRRSRSPRGGRRRSAPSSRCGRSAPATASWPALLRPAAARRSSAGSASIAARSSTRRSALVPALPRTRADQVGDTALLRGARSARRRTRTTAPARGSCAGHSRRGSRRGPSRCPVPPGRSGGEQVVALEAQELLW